MRRLFNYLTIGVVSACVLCGVNSAWAFSDEYEPYYPHITAVTRSVDEIYARISGSTVELPEEVVKARKDMIQMYKDVGIDVSLDMESWLGSYRLVADFPQRWSKETPIPLGESVDYAKAFSIDAPWNNPIPEGSPKVLIPRSALKMSDIHIGVVKANIDMGGWGTGLPQIVSTSADPLYTIATKYNESDIEKVNMLRAKANLYDYVNNAQTGDEQIIFVDSESNTGLQTWLSRVPGDPRGYGLKTNRLPNFDIRCGAASVEYALDGIGAEGRVGSNAANTIMNAYTIKSSEISSTTDMIEHAIGGAIGSLVPARVYPAISIDGFMVMSGENEGSRDARNKGIVPYGGIIQVDPELDIKAIYDAGKLSFHSYRILTAMQKYGFYNIDYSGGSFHYYTSTYSKDWVNSDFRGFDVPYKNNAQGFDKVIDEIEAFFAGDEFFGLTEEVKLYVTIPVMKYADLDVNDDGVIDTNDYNIVFENVDLEITDGNRQCDVNQDKVISIQDVEIMHNYLNDLPIHTFTWYDISLVDNDETHGRVLSSGTSRTVDGVKKFREGSLVSFSAVPENGYIFDGWTGDFAEYGKTPVVKVTMDRDYSFGAKYKKLEDVNLTVKVQGNGHIELSETGIYHDAPKSKYGKNTLVTLKAVADEGYEFLGWAGDLAGYTNPENCLLDRDKEIIAMFGEVSYHEDFRKDNWVLASGEETAYKITEGKNISFSSFTLGNQKVVRTMKDKAFDLSGDFTISAKFSTTTRMNNGNRNIFIFNYKDDRNYYYISLGCAGKVELYKVYKKVETKLGEYKGKLQVGDVFFDSLPLTIEVTKSGKFITVTGYRDGGKLEYLRVRDTSLKGGSYGFGSMYNGAAVVADVKVSKALKDPSKAVVQVWTKTGNNDPWLERLRGAVAVAADSEKAYYDDNYQTIDANIKPYCSDDRQTVYVPVKYITEKLGGKVTYDPVTDSVVVSYGEHTATLKAWTNGVQEINGTMYAPAKLLADALGKEFYQYKAVVFFSDTVNVYDPYSEPECVDFINATFDIKYYKEG